MIFYSIINALFDPLYLLDLLHRRKRTIFLTVTDNTVRLGLTDSKDPYKVEMQLREILPPEESNAFCHRLVLFGRDVCSARSPRCADCPLADGCPGRDGGSSRAVKAAK